MKWNISKVSFLACEESKFYLEGLLNISHSSQSNSSSSVPFRSFFTIHSRQGDMPNTVYAKTLAFVAPLLTLSVALSATQCHLFLIKIHLLIVQSKRKMNCCIPFSCRREGRIIFHATSCTEILFQIYRPSSFRKDMINQIIIVFHEQR